MPLALSATQQPAPRVAQPTQQINNYATSQPINNAPETVPQLSAPLFQQPPQQHQASEPSQLAPQQPQPLSQQPQAPRPPPQHFPMPFYPLEPMEQALTTLLANSQVTTNLLRHVFSSIYSQSGLTPEPHGPHHLHNPTLFQHQAQRSHHPQPANHGPTDQINGQGDTMLLSSVQQHAAQSNAVPQTQEPADTQLQPNNSSTNATNPIYQPVPLALNPAQQLTATSMPQTSQQNSTFAPQALNNDTAPPLPPQLSAPIFHPTPDSAPLPNQQPQQMPQHQATRPPLPMQYYPYDQVEQALTLLTNPQAATNLFHVFNIFLQSGLRAEPHGPHHPHNPQHYQHHMHGTHPHHNHHGPNGQGNGQDDTMLTISESKPRGLTRAEIDSLTPYIQMNEKDSRTCVICLSKFELKSKIRPLSCNHAFHAKCVDKWLRANRTCPICRRDALKTYPAKLKRI